MEICQDIFLFLLIIAAPARMCRGTFFVLVAQKFIVLYNEKVRVEIIVELRKGQTEDESGYFIIRYRGI